MKPVLQAASPKMGVNRNFPRVLVCGSRMFQGLEMPHSFTMQATQHIVDIISHQLNPDITTELHKASFESLFLIVGLGTKFMSTALPGVDTDIPNTIVKSIRTFCTETKVDVQHDITTGLFRECDSFLMTHFLSADFTNTE